MPQPLYGPQPSRQALARERLAQALLGQGMDASPVQHPLQGLARMAQAYFGSQMLKKGEEDAAKRDSDYASGLNAALMGADSAGMIADRLAGSGNADLARMAPQYRMSDIEARQRQAEAAAKRQADQALKEWEYRNDPSKRYREAGGSIFDLQGADPLKPAWSKPEKPEQAEYEFKEVGGRLVAFDKRDPTRRVDVGEARGAGGFAGNAMDAQAMNVLMDPKADPNSQQYAMAYWHLTQPKPQMVPNEKGEMIMSAVAPVLPQGIRRPGTMAPMPPGASEGAAPAPEAQAAGGLPSQGASGLSVTPIGGAGKSIPMTEGQANAGLYADRMTAAEKVIDRVGQAGLGVRDRVLGSLPGVGNFMVSPEYQQLEQAQRDFINATLRRESGAVISDQEFDNARKQYFPRPGDTPETLAQKKANRETAISGISRAAGPTYKSPGAPGSRETPPPPPGFQMVP